MRRRFYPMRKNLADISVNKIVDPEIWAQFGHSSYIGIFWLFLHRHELLIS